MLLSCFYPVFYPEEATFYCQFLRRHPTLLAIWERRLVECYCLDPKLCWLLAGVSLYGPSSTRRDDCIHEFIFMSVALQWSYLCDSCVTNKGRLS